MSKNKMNAFSCFLKDERFDSWLEFTAFFSQDFFGKSCKLDGKFKLLEVSWEENCVRA